MISDHTSGSTFSAAAVDPLTSQNNIVITRRSPIIASWARAASNLVISSRGINLSKAGVFSCPLLSPTTIVSEAPQFMQNLASSGLIVWQLEHFILLEP